MTKLYLFDIKNYLKSDNEKFKLIPPSFKKRIDRYKDESDKLRSSIGYYLLIKYLKEDFNIEINDEDILTNKFDKPYIKNNPIYFSISHSLNFVGVLLSDNECGLDIQHDDNLTHEKLAKKILLDKEYEMYEKNRDILFKKWVQIEAYYKKMGTGIKYNNLDISIDYMVYEIFDNQNNKYYLSATAKFEKVILKKL